MRILISGVTGLIGGTVAELLTASGHEVVGLSRSSRPGTVQWDPLSGSVDRGQLGAIDAILHLAGESIGGRWTERKRAAILESRVTSTRLLGDLASDVGVSVFVSGSAIGFYGDRGAEILTEASEPGEGFLPEVVRAWEAAASPAVEAGVRTVFARTGLVLDRESGSLPPLLRLFRLGAGGRLGSGDQYWSWIGVTDEARALCFLIEDADIEGPVNVVSPNPIMNKEFADVLGSVLHRPAFVPAPAMALRLVLGADFADELLLSSQRVIPAKLLEAGFEFEHPDLRTALTGLLLPG